MRDYKIILISFVLLFLMIGVASAATVNENLTDSDPGGFVPEGDIIVGGTEEYYVNDTGDDSNEGSSDSPYASISKAVSNVDSSVDTTIYLSQGTFGSDNDSNFEIELNHEQDGGSLSFIGAGTDKTFIDGQSAFRFAYLGYGTNVLFKDIAFINFKQNNGATLLSEGSLTIENCAFINSYATDSKGGAIYSAYGPELIVKNTIFENCSVNYYNPYSWGPKGGGAIFTEEIQNLYLENNTFINTRICEDGGYGVAVYSAQSKSYIFNNKFINLKATSKSQDASIFINSQDSVIANNTFINCSNPSKTYSIVSLAYGSYLFENNTFINASNDVGCAYISGNFVTGLKFTMPDEVIDVGNAEINNGVKIKYNATDNMGNIVKVNSFIVNFVNENNTYTYSPSSDVIRFDSMPAIGIYNVTITSASDTTDVLTTANVHYSNELVELYVSPNGSDANNGTLSAPFATISHALDVGFEKTFNVVIHLLNGTYSSEGNAELDISGKGTLKIIGEKYGETIIDGSNANWFLNVRLDAVIENVTFADIYSENGQSIIRGNNRVTLLNCIIDNNDANEGYVLENVFFDNLVYTNNNGVIFFGYSNEETVINNSYFANNKDIWGVCGALYISRDNVVIENCKFINNTASQYGAAIYSSYGFTSKDNYYYGNKAPNSAAVYIDYNNECSFDNDTFINNQATTGNYAVIGVTNSRNAPKYNFNNCRFINNTAVRGGAIGINQGSIIGCSFINNTADYGGAIVAMPITVSSYYLQNPEQLEAYIANNGYTNIRFEDITFENNIAKINGNDLYIDTPTDSRYGYYYKFITATVNFNDKNVTSLSGELTADVIGPCGASIGGSLITFELDGFEIGSAEIQNGVATLDYDGFNDGTYTLGGDAQLNATVKDATINVKVDGLVSHNEVWVSSTGSDENGNGSETNPFASISYALNYVTKNCRDVVVHIGEGVYTGELNTALKLSAVNNITLVGAGLDKTIIDGQNTTYFAKITSGLNKVIISDLTIKNMLPDNRQSSAIDQSMVPIAIGSDATLYLTNVVITDNHGGSAIIENEGNLFIDNSVISKNGIATFIIHGGNITIDNSLFEANFAQSGIIYGSLVKINNSVFNNQFVFTRFGLVDRDYMNAGSNFAFIENTIVYNDGDNSSLSLLGIEKVDTRMNPAVAITTDNVYMNNVSMINNFKSQVYEYQYSYGDGSQLAAFGYLYGSTGKTIEVYNSSFANYKFIWCVNTYGMLNFTFDGCVFENFTMIAQSQTANLQGTEGENSIFNISNSIFINTDPAIDRQNRGDRPNPVCDFNDNYWGNNSKPVITFVNPAQNQNTTYEPETWIILTTEDDEIVFKLTDGENTTEYYGTLPAKISYVADENGDVIPVVNINGDGYKLAADEKGNLIINTSAAPMEDIVPKVPANETVFANDISLKIGEAAVFTANFTDKWGDPLKNTNISFVIGDKTINKTTDANGTASFDIDFALGLYKVDITNPATLQSISNTISITTDDTIAAIDVAATYGIPSKFTANFTDQYGVALANVNVTFKVGNGIVNAITDVNGTASFDIDLKPGIFNVDITNPVTSQKLSKTITVTAAETISAIDVTATYGIPSKFTATFTDEFGKALSNITVTFKVGENTINATTDVNGTASFTIDFNAGVYNVTVANPVTSQVVTKSIVVNKLATALTAPAVTTTYNVAKNLEITLKDANGNALANANVILNINGKNVPLTTDKDGKAKYSVKLPAKTYTATITYAGDDKYVQSTVDAKVVVNKAKVKLTAKKKTFKAKVKTKKYTVTLKDNKGKAMNKVKLTLTIKKKKFTAKTNKKGKATFKIKKLSKGKYNAKVKFAGNKNFKNVTKKVKITVKK